jgi:hypothetical protein
MQDVTLFILYVEYSPPLWSFLHFFISHTISPIDRLHPSFSTKFQNFPGISDLLSEVSYVSTPYITMLQM